VLADGPSSVEPLREKFPARSVVGEPKKRATQIIRELEASSRRAWGGAVGYAIPGGSFELTVPRVTVIARRGFLEVTGAAELAKGLTPEASAETTWSDARAAFAAIRAATTWRRRARKPRRPRARRRKPPRARRRRSRAPRLRRSRQGPRSRARRSRLKESGEAATPEATSQQAPRGEGGG
jgi:hypothetical protein